MNRYGFLFARFRPGCHWYALVLAGKNLITAMVPVVPGSVSQWCMLLLALFTYNTTTLLMLPWRHTVVNVLDSYLTSGLLVVACFGGVFLDLNSVDASTLSTVGAAVIVAMPLGICCLAMYPRRGGRGV